MKKVLSLLLAVVMVIGMLPMGILSASAAAAGESVTYTFSDYATGQQYAQGEEHTLDDTVTLTINGAHLNGQVRLYNGSNAVLTSKLPITQIIVNAGNKAGTLTVSTSANGTEWTDAEAISTTTSYTDYTVAFETGAKYVKLTSAGAQIRVKYVTLTFGEATACAHANTTEVAAVEATCTAGGYTAGVQCTDCGEYTSGHEAVEALGHSYGDWVVSTAATCTTAGEQSKTCTVCGDVVTEAIDATGHSYGEDGICSVCSVNQADAVSYELVTADSITAGNYIIGAVRGGTYPTVYPATNTVSGNWTVSNNSVTAVDDVITSDMFPADAQVFVLEGNNAEGFTIGYNNGTEMVYLGYTDITTNNTMAFSADYSTIKWTVAAVEAGGVSLHTTDGTNNYAISQNSSAATAIRAYNAADKVYKGIYLFAEVVEGEEECTHATTEVVNASAATCTETGYTGDTVCSDCGTVVTKGSEIEATGHTYVDGVCACGAADPSVSGVTTYELMTADTVRAGNYIIGAIRSSTVTYPAVYPATGAISNGDIVVAGTSVTATNDMLTADLLEGAQVFVLTGDNTNGFTIGYNNGTEMVYLGYTAIGNRKLAFSADYSDVYWKVSTFGSGVMLSDGNVNIFENSTGTGAIRGYTTTYTSARGIYLFREVVANECVHTVETWTVDTAATCTTSGVQSGACTQCGQTQTSVIPATGHSFAYTESAIVCSNGCDYSQAYTLSTIADVKAYTDTTATYYFKGVVTYSSAGKVYVEDSTGGVLVMFTSADAAADIALGDEILVWDTMTTYNGLIETTYTLASEYVKVSSGNTLPSQTVTISALTADTTNEYLAERVVIENVTVGTINESGNTALTDADGNSIDIYKVSGLAENVTEGDTVTVTAIVSTFNGYQLLINPGTAAADVVVTTEGDATVVETVSIADAKAGTAGEYYQVEGVVTFIDGRNVYIQDSTGGIVVYLTATAANTAVGDKVKAYGSLTSYTGLIELTGVDETNTEFYEVLSGDNTVEAQTVTIADLTADTTNEYLAEKVTIENAYISVVGTYSDSYKNVNYTLKQGDDTILVFRAPAATEADVLAAGSIVTVEAIVSSYNGYQLRVVDATKITVTGACAHENTTLTNASEAGCETAGYTGDTYCDTCGVQTGYGEEIPALGHVYVDGTCSVCGQAAPVAEVSGTQYTTFADAVANCDPSSEYIKLLANLEVNVTLDDNVYIDLNGYTLTGTMITGGCKVYGMDTTTDGYSCDNMGAFNCVDEDGTAVVPEQIIQVSAAVAGTAKRYLAIQTENGYTFHRFYLGITHATVKPTAKGVGYKAVFAGDDMVKAEIDTFGYSLQVEGFDAVTQSKAGTEMVSGEYVTLRVQNYDVETYGETGLTASVYMTIGDQTITSTAVTLTLRQMVEKINDMTLTEEQKTALAAWIAESETMQAWNVSNIYTAE